MRLFIALAVAALASPVAAAPYSPHQLIPGAIYEDKGPDGNTIILDAPKGLIVVDTGRHPDHVQKILEHSNSAGKPVAAIINTHWHLDHTTGNMDVLAAFPEAAIVSSRGIEGRLFRDFIAPGRAQAKKSLADGSAPEARRPAMLRAQAFLDEPRYGRPTMAITRSGSRQIAGRTIDVRLAPFAVSEGDVWLVIPEEKMVIAGDLVVDIVPFMDTACVEGWERALEDISAVDFETLIPGHGPPMSKPQFIHWKTAFGALVDCGRTDAAISECVEGWMTNAAPFIAEDKKAYSREAATYYVETRLRSKPEERQKFCAAPKD